MKYLKLFENFDENGMNMPTNLGMYLLFDKKIAPMSELFFF